MSVVTRHKRTLLAAAATLAIAAAGCGSDDGGARVAKLDGGAATPTKTAKDAALAATGKRVDSDDIPAAAAAYATCLRANGLANYPDPKAEGPLYSVPPPWTDSGFSRRAPQVLKAAKACAAERGRVFGAPTDAAIAATRKQVTDQARCMRAHEGFEDYPDPEVDGKGVVSDRVPASVYERPGFREAASACGASLSADVK